MTATTLRSYTLKDLARLAKQRGVHGWHSMRKDQLVRAILRVKKPKPAAKAASVKKASTPVRRVSPTKAGVVPSRNGARVRTGVPGRNGASGRNSAASRALALRRDASRRLAKRAQVTQRIEQARLRLIRSKNLAFEQARGKAGAAVKDRLIVMVRGPFWLHAYWELTPQGIVRAQAALGQEWHGAQPMLRLLVVTSGSATTTSERVLREIPIHGGVQNWYVDVQAPARTYRLEIGYLTASRKFHSLARSNVVNTPVGTSSDTLDAHWKDVLGDCDKIYAMSGGFASEGATELQELFEERLHRPMVSGNGNRFGAGAECMAPHNHALRFQVDAEMVIHGVTQADARVTLQGEPLKLRADGSFSVRVDLPNRRQVIPLVASTKDGVEQRTIVLAVERNTKIMEPLTRDSGE
jgi:uncharacterized protein